MARGRVCFPQCPESPGLALQTIMCVCVCMNMCIYLLLVCNTCPRCLNMWWLRLSRCHPCSAISEAWGVVSPVPVNLNSIAEKYWISLVAQMVKNLPAIQETRLRSLGQEDPLEDGMATHSSILTWKIPWTEQSGRLQSMRLQRARHDWATNTCTIGEKRLINQKSRYLRLSWRLQKWG